MLKLLMAVFMVSLPVFANDGSDYRAYRQDSGATRQAQDGATLEGTLSCIPERAPASDFQNCTTFQFQDERTGQVYRLSKPGDAQKLFSRGSRRMAIQGTVSSSEQTIEVRKAEAL
jgi:hypothetical protein